jgi:hypothetical protein
MISALVILAVAGISLFIGYKIGAHDALDNAEDVINNAVIVGEDIVLPKPVNNGMGLLRPGIGAPYEPMSVYREYKPIKDAVEYTVYFHKDGVKNRLDTEITLKDLDVDTVENVEDLVKNKIFAMIEAGEYKPADKAIE